MQEAVAIQHPPAVKVGGRRLSISAKPKPRAPSPPAPVEPVAAADNVDYPRPVSHSDDQAVQHNPPPHIEEDVPSKREKKQDHEMHLKELAHRKAEHTRPSKDSIGGHKGFGAAGRIAQPAGKSFAI